MWSLAHEDAQEDPVWRILQLHMYIRSRSGCSSGMSVGAGTLGESLWTMRLQLCQGHRISTAAVLWEAELDIVWNCWCLVMRT